MLAKIGHQATGFALEIQVDELLIGMLREARFQSLGVLHPRQRDERYPLAVDRKQRRSQAQSQGGSLQIPWQQRRQCA